MVTFCHGLAAGMALANARDAKTNSERVLWVVVALVQAMVPLVPHVMRRLYGLEERST